MSFLFIQSADQDLLSKAKKLFSDEYNASHEWSPDKMIFYDKDKTFYHIDDKNALVMSGRILYDNISEDESKRRFIKDIESGNWPLPEEVSGFFSGFLVTNNDLYIFTDAVGMYFMYYFISPKILIVSTNLYTISHLVSPSINMSTLILETIPPFSSYGNKTVLNNTNRLFPGELLKINEYVVHSKKYDNTIKQFDNQPDENFVEELVHLINTEVGKFYKGEKEVILPLSGGVDSRINLMALLANKIPFKAINYGKKGSIETEIPLRLAKKFNFPLEIIDPAPEMFPNKEVLWDILKKTDSIYVNVWHALILKKDGDENKFLLLGDVLDVLRAKRINSWKSRKFRTKFYIKKFLFGSHLPLTPFNRENLNAFQQKKKEELRRKVESRFNFFDIKDEAIKNKILKEVENNLQDFFEHLSRYKFATIQSYEELFNLFTNSRIGMAKQLNILRYKYKAEIPLSNIKVLRKVLNISPEYRYADELTTRMFKTASWKKGGNIPTNQNPFFSYTAPFYLMLLGWFIRSKTDYFLTKLSILTRGKWKRKRLIKTYEYTGVYNFSGAFEHFKSYFTEEQQQITGFKDLITLYEKRMNGQSWPLSPMDLMPYVQAAFWHNLMGRNHLQHEGKKI